jgi:hypothetical protein
MCSGDQLLKRWEPSTIRTFLIRMAAKLGAGVNGLFEVSHFRS